MWQGHLHEALGKGICKGHTGGCLMKRHMGGSHVEEHMGASHGTLRHDYRLALGRVEGHPGQGIR